MAKAKKVKKTEGGNTLREGDTSKVSNASISIFNDDDKSYWESEAPKKKKKKKKIRSFKPKKPVKGILESQGY